MRKNIRQRPLAILLVLLIGLLWTQCKCQKSPNKLPQPTSPTPPEDPTPPKEITDAMINDAESRFPFLAKVLRKLQQGEAGAINGPDPNGGKGALHYAAELGDAAIVQALIDKEAEIEAKDALGKTPLHAAAYGGDKETIELLIAKGADTKAKDKDGQTPLHEATFRGGKETIELLIANGAEIEATNHKGETPYQMAQSKGYPKEILDLLNPSP